MGEDSGEGDTVGEGAVGVGDETGLCVDGRFGVGFSVASDVGSFSGEGVGDGGGVCEGLT